MLISICLTLSLTKHHPLSKSCRGRSMVVQLSSFQKRLRLTDFQSKKVFLETTTLTSQPLSIFLVSFLSISFYHHFSLSFYFYLYLSIFIFFFLFSSPSFFLFSLSFFLSFLSIFLSIFPLFISLSTYLPFHSLTLSIIIYVRDVRKKVEGRVST